MYPCIKFLLIWRTSVFETRFTQKRLYGGVFEEAQPENNLERYYNMAGFR